jgi:uncharacterized membrane protein
LTKGRLEAFSDAVIAIILTIMVLELKVPHGAELVALRPLLPVFLSYVLSFVYLGIYWNNHHHFFHAVSRIGGGVLWANLHLLFWLSLFPFTTGWMGENHLAAIPTAVYGLNLLLAAIAWYIMQCAIIRAEGTDSRLRAALGSDLKGKLSPVIYAAGIGVAFVMPWLSMAMYVFVALMWLVPDLRIEKGLSD